MRWSPRAQASRPNGSAAPSPSATCCGGPCGPVWEATWLGLRPAGSPEAALSARARLGRSQASACLGQSAARAALAPRPDRPGLGASTWVRTVSSACTVYDEIESGTDQRQRSGISRVGRRSMSSPSAARKAASSTWLGLGLGLGLGFGFGLERLEPHQLEPLVCAARPRPRQRAYDGEAARVRERERQPGWRQRQGWCSSDGSGVAVACSDSVAVVGGGGERRWVVVVGRAASRLRSRRWARRSRSLASG